MGRWNEARWVSDGGLRYYFSERNPGGPSQLECYRRLLAEPVDKEQNGRRRFSRFGPLEEVLELVHLRSQRFADVRRAV